MRPFVFGLAMGLVIVVGTLTMAWADMPVVFTAHNYGFSGPDSLPPGMTTIRVVNQGQDMHQIQVLKLLHGKTSEDFRSAVAAEPTRIPSWVRFVGGPNATNPGADAVATMWLSEGEYLLICLIPNQQGTPHVALGMQKALSVRGAKPVSTSNPQADATIAQRDFRFDLSGAVTPGTRTLRVVNHGTQPHEVVLVKLAAGATAQEFAVAIDRGLPGHLPGMPIGGVVGIEQGTEAFFTAEFEPGNYGVICFFPDRATGAMHYTKGMLFDFTVQ